MPSPSPSLSGSSTSVLPHIEFATGPAPQWTVIWLHGLGADGYDFAPVVRELQLKASPEVRFIFPHAPSIPITCNNGYVMPGWYDIRSLDRIDQAPDEAGVSRSRESIRALIARENQRGISTSHIVLAGFSQGGAIAYVTALTHPEALAGIVALSTYIPTPALLEAEAHAANARTPLFAAHGRHDPIIPFGLGEQTAKTISQGRDLEWHAFDMAHSTCEVEIDALGKWFRARFAED